MIAAGIRDVYVIEESQTLFNEQARDPGAFEEVDLKVYVSGSLTNLNDASVKTLYEQIGQLAQTHGFEAHVPHLHTDPVKNAAAIPEEVYAFDLGHLKDSDVVIAYIGEPSLGTGMELEMALKHNALVVLLSEKGAKLSRLALGSPTIIEHVQFDSHADALSQLGTVFQNLLKAAKRKNMSSVIPAEAGIQS
jgi:nucleoside 2-deoxyribosyltransferase